MIGIRIFQKWSKSESKPEWSKSESCWSKSESAKCLKAISLTVNVISNIRDRIRNNFFLNYYSSRSRFFPASDGAHRVKFALSMILASLFSSAINVFHSSTWYWLCLSYVAFCCKSLVLDSMWATYPRINFRAAISICAQAILYFVSGLSGHYSVDEILSEQPIERYEITYDLAFFRNCGLNCDFQPD